MDFSRLLSVFQVLFKANLIFKDFSRQSCIFKYFSSLCEPWPYLVRNPEERSRGPYIFIITCNGVPEAFYSIGSEVTAPAGIKEGRNLAGKGFRECQRAKMSSEDMQYFSFFPFFLLSSADFFQN